MMMSNGEVKLRYDLFKAFEEVRAIGDPDQIAGYIDAVIEALTNHNYFINCGEVLEVLWDNIGFVDGVEEPFYSIKVENYNADDYWEPDSGE